MPVPTDPSNRLIAAVAVSVAVGAWSADAPPPAQAKKLNPSLIAVPENAPPGKPAPRIVIFPDDPLPQTKGKLPLVVTAVQVDNPPRKQGLTYVPPPDLHPSYQLNQRRLLNPSRLAVPVDNPPRLKLNAALASQAHWRVEFTLPQTGRDLAPLAAVVADNPPRKQGLTYVPPSTLDPSYQLQRRLLNPSITAVPENSPPGTASPKIVPIDDPPLPQVNAKLAQPFVAPAANPTFARVEQFHAAWRVETALPQVNAKLSPAGLSVDNPPRYRAYVPTWPPDPPLPTLGEKVVPVTTVAPVDAPPPKRGLTYVPPPDLDPSYLLQRRPLNPQLTAVPENPPPGAARPAIVVVDDPPLPQVNRKLVPATPAQVDNPPPISRAGQALVASWDITIPIRNVAPVVTPSGAAGPQVDNPPFSYRRFSWGPGAAVVNTISGGALVQSLDNPPFGAFYTSNNVVPLAWRPVDPPPTLRRGLPASALAVRVDTVLSVREPWAIQAAWRILGPQPTLPDKLVPIPAAVDNPPLFRGTTYIPPPALDPSYQLQKKLLNPQLLAVAVDVPPGAPGPRIVPISDDVLPQVNRKLPQGAAPAQADTVLSTPQQWSIQSAWRGPDPLPTLRNKLSPSITAVAVDDPPFNSRRLDTRWPEAAPLPTLPVRLVPIAAPATADTVLSRPQLPPAAWWDVPPLPTLDGKLNPALLAVRVDNPPTTRIPLDLTPWIPPAPQPTLSGKLPPAITAVQVDTILYKPDRSSIYAAWQPPPPLPTPSVRPTIPTDGPTPPPPPTDGMFTVSGRDVRALFLFDGVSAPYSPTQKRTN